MLPPPFLSYCAAALLLLDIVSASPVANLDSLSSTSQSAGISAGAISTTSQPSPKIHPKSGCASNCTSSLRFANPDAKRFEVTNEIPSNTFRTHTSWAGEMPNSASLNNTLFFWLWGAEGNGSPDDTVIWLNGGPGCSSLIGFLQENGPISYNPAVSAPHPNQYSWSKTANMLWVEQPSGVGFSRASQKTPRIESEAEIAASIVTFLANMKKTFPELFAPGKRLWIAGESYGGQYVPYIADKIYSDGNKYNLQGVLIVDGLFSDYTLQTDVTTYEYALRFNAILKLSTQDMDDIRSRSTSCGYTGYTAANLHYPSRGPLPPFSNRGCGTYQALLEGASKARPNFNVYRITDNAKYTNVLNPTNSNDLTWFDNIALQDAIHADHKKWCECTDAPFKEFTFDRSAPPATNGVLQRVIESAPSKRNVIVQGSLDARLLLNGTLLALQNLTWNSGRGFDEPISVPLIDTNGKVAGTFRTQRGLTAAIAAHAGHLVPSPQDAPALGVALLRFLIGQGQLS